MQPIGDMTVDITGMKEDIAMQDIGVEIGKPVMMGIVVMEDSTIWGILGAM